MDVRLPRAILAGVVGLGLSVSGAVYQGIFRNPLADPYLLGVAQGCALGAVLGFMMPFGFGSIPLFAFLGGILAISLVYLIGRVGRFLPTTTLILAGVAVGAFFSSITYFLLVRAKEELHGILFWLLGGFFLTDWGDVFIVTPYVIIGSLLLSLYGRALNVMQLGEEEALYLGVNVERTKLVLILLSTIITASCVSFCGIIGFVGLIMPHLVRLIWGTDYRFLIPLSGALGFIFLILADTFARVILSPIEIPVGVITAFCGAPFFLYILRRRRVVL